MVSGLEVTALGPVGQRPDSGGFVGLLAEAGRQLAGVPRRVPPSVVMLARCFHGFAVVGLVSQVMYDRYVPRPEKCRPVAQECESIAAALIEVIGTNLHAKHWVNVAAFDAGLSDSRLASVGPDLAGAVDQMVRVAHGIREICDHIATDTAALPQLRVVADQAVLSATFVLMQYGT